MMPSPELLIALATAHVENAQRLDAMGLVARSAVHELNNQMVSILGLAELVFNALPHDHPLRMDIQEIRVAGDRAVTKIRELALMTYELTPAGHAR